MKRPSLDYFTPVQDLASISYKEIKRFQFKPVFTTQHTLCCEYTAESAGFVLNRSGNVAYYKLDVGLQSLLDI